MPLPQDRSQRHASAPFARTEKVQASGIRKQPWSLRQPPASSTGTAAFNLRLGQFVDNGHSIKLVTTLKEMKEYGLRPDILTYNSAMELFGKLAMEDEAWALIDDMKALGISPDIETFKFLLEVHLTSTTFLESPNSNAQAVRHAPHEATWSVLKMMKEAGIEHTAGSYALLIRKYLHDSNLEMAFKILVEMEGRGLTPTLKTAEGIITLAAQRRMPRLALELAENFEASSVRRLGMHVWVSCLLSSSECLYVSVISSLSYPALLTVSAFLRKKAFFIYGPRSQMNSRLCLMKGVPSRYSIQPVDMGFLNWLRMCSAF
jgi:pentatricopeptide repeat protein